MLVLRGYFDESGTHSDSEAVTVAGYLSTAEQWELFEGEWISVLHEWGLDYFHMSEFANRANQYRTWADQDRRFRFARLVRIINCHVLVSIGFTIPKRSFDHIFPKRAKRFIGGAYGLAANCCFMDAAKVVDSLYPSARIAYVFESGARGAGEILKVFQWNCKDPGQKRRLKLLSLKFEGKEFVPLQAADILAYELYRYLPHLINENSAKEPRLENLHMLADCKLRMWGRLDDEELFKFAAIASAAAAEEYGGGAR